MENAVSISVPVIVALSAELLFSIALPVALLVVWKIKARTKLMPALIGAFTFVIAVMMLEQLLHSVLLGTFAPTQNFLLSHPLIYATYGGLAAGIFEETARFIVFRTIMKNYTGRENGVTFGLGYAGVECFIVLGMTMISNLLMAVSFNSMGFEAFIAQYAEGQNEAVMQAVASINTIDVLAAITACVERAVTMLLQVELTLYVYAAVKLNKFYMYPLALMLHAAVDFFSGLYQAGALPSPYVMEGAFLLYALLLIVPVRKIYDALPAEEPVLVDRFGRPI